MARKLIVEIVGDSKSYERALNKSATATNQFGQAMGSTSPKLGKLSTGMAAAGTSSVFLAGAAGGLAVALGTKSVQAASSLNEEIAKSQQIFEGSADEIKKWSETTAESIGISQVAALQATGTFGGLFSVLGVGAAENAKLSRSLVELAADMASFNNANPEDVLIALRSGLAGEAEPLRRFSVFLSEARVQQVALNETGKASVKQLTNQEKALARYSIIMRDTVKQQGDVERTSESLANQQRKLAAQVKDLEAALGTVLIPTVTAVVTALNDAITVGNDLAGVLKTLAGLPGIEIPIKLVSEVTEGRGADILRHVVLGGISPLALGITIGKEIADGIRAGAGEAAFAIPTRPEEGVAGAERGAARAADKAAKAERDRANAIIDSITRQATTQKSLNTQLAESERRAAHLRDLIREDPDNVKLQQRLTAELKKQGTLRAEQVSLGKQNAASAQAAAVAAKSEAEAAADARREREREAAEARRTRAENQRKARQAAQFKALGLTAEGLKPTPGTGSLLRRATGLEEQIKGTPLDTKATRERLRKIVSFLKTHMKTAGKDVRQAILSMLNEISGAFKQGADTGIGGRGGGEITKGGIRSTQALLRGLDLSEEERRILTQRNLGRTGRRGLSAFGVGIGQSPAASGVRAAATAHALPPINIRLEVDGKQLAAVVIPNLQKSGRRSSGGRRGRHGGANLGLQ